MRDTLIDAILDLSSDEIETHEDLVEIAKESEQQLVERLIGIACFYRDQLQDCNQ